VRLLAAVLAGLLVLFWLLGVAADYLAAKIPFSYEQAIGGGILPDEVTAGEVPAYLRDLTQRLVEVMDLPEGMTIQVHYSNDDVVNAYATLGGNVVIFHGLLEKLPHENALAMVLAHEIAHIKYRHPVRSLGRGVVIALAMGALSGATGNTLGSSLVGETGMLTVLEFSRDQEEAADAEGLRAVARLYGTATGSTDLFRLLLEEEAKAPLKVSQLEFLRTHPLGEHRIEAMEGQIHEQHWSMNAATTPLPSFVLGARP
jgi:predicted Zn-dependent protease